MHAPEIGTADSARLGILGGAEVRHFARRRAKNAQATDAERPYAEGMASRTEVLSVSVPGLRAVRRSTDELHSGMKEAYAIARVEAGRSTWWTRGGVREVSPGVVKIQQPGDVHRDVSRDGPSTVLVVSFPTPMVESLAGKICVHPLLAAEDPRGAPFQRLHDAVRAGAERFELDVAVAEAIAALVTIGDAKPHHAPPVRRALEVLHDRLAASITLDDLATHAGIDKFHLCRAFRAQVGMPPHAYLTHLRIMRAKALLAGGTRPSDIAAQVGLYDQSQLNRHFRRIVGTTPGRYLRDPSARFPVFPASSSRRPP
jgi:AraC-like DNA-binding protein